MLLNLVFPFKRLLFVAHFFDKRMYFNNIYGGKGYDDIREYWENVLREGVINIPGGLYQFGALLAPDAGPPPPFSANPI